ncbi:MULTISPECIES: biotin synthase BioB [Streptomyces]|jgi:biotin synthase|uniref:biotin synthase BioB n=1 Tax=Streptomyces TaxID=1883 RepID=UPI001EFB891B|nr:radical SAM protein [Streptomyces sp. CL12-4]MCG8969532.1 radical SAM protein [Streptomyces sp. CL12-4]
MLTRSDIRAYLTATGPAQEELFAEARRLREEHFGPTVILRGVIEITNVCRVNCDYCPMRRDNTPENDHYFMSSDDIVARAHAIRDAGIDIVLLQGGETPRNVATLEDAIPRIRELFDGRVEILLNLGNLRRSQYQRLRDLGATSYILKHETSDPDLHQAIRHESLQTRLRCFRDLVDLGYRVGTGLISSLPGQTLDSIVDDIELAETLGAHMCSVAPFVPAPDTPLQLAPAGSNELALNTIAVLRLHRPQMLIPSVSALEKTSAGGQSRGLEAGANVMTVNFTGADDQQRYLIYGKDRYVVRKQHVEELTRASGLRLRGSVFLDPERNTDVPVGAGTGKPVS